MFKVLRYMILSLFVVMFTACGGGGGTEIPTETATDQEIAIKTIKTYAKNGGIAPTLKDYENAGVTGVDADTLVELNSMVLELEEEDVDTLAEIQVLANALGLNINLVPIALPQNIIVDEGNSSIILTGTDADNDTLTYTVVTQPTHGTLTGTAPNLNYAATANFSGVDSFTFKVNDGMVDSSTATVSITVNDIEELDTIAPVVTLTGANPQTIEKGTAYSELGATTDDGSTVVIDSSSVNTNVEGDYTVTYDAADSAGNSATQVVRRVYVVYTDNTAPVFTSSATATVAENQTFAITLVATDATAVSYSISGGDAADFDVNSTTGVVTFKVAPDFETRNTYTFTATATDSSDNEATQDVSIEISNEDEAIVHNGTAYGVVTSPYTGKEWLDRNLGASQVCTSFDDAACYGDYYQWGRNYDGHQESNSDTTTLQATEISNAGSEFITDDGTYDYDWAKEADANGDLRSANWSKTDGSSVCPVGFRVPTIDELKAELLDSGSAEIQDRDDAYKSFLKLPSSGFRRIIPASMNDVGLWGYIWSSSASESVSPALYFSFDDAVWYDDDDRAYAQSVRCLRD